MHVQVGESGHLGVVLTDDYLRPGLQEYNRQALADGRPWLLVKPVGCQLWVGPVFQPGTTGCWECLAQRLGLNRAAEAYLQAKTGAAEPFPVARAVTPATPRQRVIAREPIAGMRKNVVPSVPTIEPKVDTP